MISCLFRLCPALFFARVLGDGEVESHRPVAVLLAKSCGMSYREEQKKMSSLTTQHAPDHRSFAQLVGSGNLGPWLISKTPMATWSRGSSAGCGGKLFRSASPCLVTVALRFRLPPPLWDESKFRYTRSMMGSSVSCCHAYCVRGGVVGL